MSMNKPTVSGVAAAMALTLFANYADAACSCKKPHHITVAHKPKAKAPPVAKAASTACQGARTLEADMTTEGAAAFQNPSGEGVAAALTGVMGDKLGPAADKYMEQDKSAPNFFHSLAGVIYNKDTVKGVAVAIHPTVNVGVDCAGHEHIAVNTDNMPADVSYTENGVVTPGSGPVIIEAIGTGFGIAFEFKYLSLAQQSLSASLQSVFTTQNVTVKGPVGSVFAGGCGDNTTIGSKVGGGTNASCNIGNQSIGSTLGNDGSTTSTGTTTKPKGTHIKSAWGLENLPSRSVQVATAKAYFSPAA